MCVGSTFECLKITEFENSTSTACNTAKYNLKVEQAKGTDPASGLTEDKLNLQIKSAFELKIKEC
jgi:hypothetical protein